MITKSTDIGDLFWVMKRKQCPILYAEQKEMSYWIYGEYDAISATNDTYTPERRFAENQYYLFSWECFDLAASV